MTVDKYVSGFESHEEILYLAIMTRFSLPATAERRTQTRFWLKQPPRIKLLERALGGTKSRTLDLFY